MTNGVFFPANIIVPFLSVHLSLRDFRAFCVFAVCHFLRAQQCRLSWQQQKLSDKKSGFATHPGSLEINQTRMAILCLPGKLKFDYKF